MTLMFILDHMSSLDIFLSIRSLLLLLLEINNNKLSFSSFCQAIFNIILHFLFIHRRKWSIVLRTQLSVRVHACIGKSRIVI